MSDTHPPTASFAPRTRMHPDARRQALIRAAYVIIATKGFEGIRTREVAAAAGVNHATLHHYFADKEALVRAVVAHALNQFVTYARTRGNSDIPWERLCAEFATARETLRTDPMLEMVLSELAARAARDATVRAALHEMDDFWHASVTATLADGVRDGSFRADLDPAPTAALIIALLRGLRLQSALAPERAAFDCALAMVEQLIVNHERDDT